MSPPSHPTSDLRLIGQKQHTDLYNYCIYGKANNIVLRQTTKCVHHQYKKIRYQIILKWYFMWQFLDQSYLCAPSPKQSPAESLLPSCGISPVHGISIISKFCWVGLTLPLSSHCGLNLTSCSAFSFKSPFLLSYLWTCNVCRLNYSFSCTLNSFWFCWHPSNLNLLLL